MSVTTKTKRCAKCGEVRSIDHFLYHATRAQSQAWGYAGSVLLQLESKNCKACRPKRKPPSKLSDKELHNKSISGDMNSFIVKHLRQERKLKAHNAQSLAARKRWVKQWQADLTAQLAPIAKEIISARNAWKYARNAGHTYRAEFFFEYMGGLKSAVNTARLTFLKNPRRPANAGWAEHIPAALIQKTKDLWNGLPDEDKQKVKTPMLVLYRAE